MHLREAAMGNYWVVKAPWIAVPESPPLLHLIGKPKVALIPNA